MAAPCAALLLSFHALAATSLASPRDTQARARARAPAAGEAREIVLTDKQAKGVHVLRTAPSYPATVFFPEPFVRQPFCADCDERGLFRLEPAPSNDFLTIKPRKFAGRQRDGSVIPADEFVTTVTVQLQHYTLILRVEYTEKRALTDARVVFTLPDRAHETAYVQAERKRFEKEAAEKLAKAETSALMRSLMGSHSCSSLSDRARGDDLVLEATEICTFGSRYFLRFFVANRSQDPVDLRAVQFRAGPNKKSLADLPDAEQLLSRDHLEHKEQANGVVGFALEDGQAVPRVFELVVQENNSPRTVSLTLTP